MTIRPLPRLLLSALLLVAALATAPATAQCTPISGSGCSGAMAVDCQGSTRIGQRLQLTCPNQGRGVAQILTIGTCDLGGSALPAFIACPTVPCINNVVLGTSTAIDTGFQPVTLQIPNAPALIGFQVCAQCADLVIQTRICFTLSGAVMITVQQ